jgi:ABC-2 type transport system permease protein
LALTAKELRKFFTSAVYMLNSGIGLIFTVIIAVVILVKRAMLTELALTLFGSADFLAAPLAVVLVFLSSMNMMSASALSLEGKNLWILKTAPISDNTVILSKVLPQIIVTTPPVLISSVILIVASGASPIYWPFLILTPLVANTAFAFLGLCFNILAPKFEFDNEAQPVKQSMAVFLTMITQSVISILAIVFTVLLLFRGYPLLSAAAGLVFFVIVAIVTAILLFIPCKQKYAKM